MTAMIDPLAVFMANLRVQTGAQPVPLVFTSIDVAIAAGLAVVTTVRRFRNAERVPIEATMTFPMPVHAVLFGLEARIDGRLLNGEAQRREAARETYENAIEHSKSAVLHEEVLRGIHVLSVANLRPGGEVEVTTRWAATLAFATLYVLVVMGPFEVLLPFAIRDRVGGGPGALSLVLAAYGVGSAAGALLVSSARLPRRYLTVMLLCWGLGALPLAAFGLSTLLWVMVVASLVLGVTDAAAMVIWGTLLQRRVPAHLLGRVSSLDFFVSLALMPISMALAGPVGERVGIPITFVVAAVVPPVLAVVALLAWRLPRDEVAHPLDRAPGEARAP